MALRQNSPVEPEPASNSGERASQTSGLTSLLVVLAFSAGVLVAVILASLWIASPSGRSPGGGREAQTILYKTPGAEGAGAAPAASATPTGALAQTPLVSLTGFYQALAELEAGRRTRPVTVLHLGDGHVFADRLDAPLRAGLQARFGDAGRGPMMPAGVVRGARAGGYRLETSGAWTMQSAVEHPDGVYGITGTSATATATSAVMSLTSLEGAFAVSEVAFLAGPDRGAAVVSVDGKQYTVVTRSPEVAIQRIRVTFPGTTLTIKPAGTGPVTVLSWSVQKAGAGVRYVAAGQPGATLRVLEALDDLMLADELRSLQPDLVVLGYGVVEAQDDNLDVGRFAERATRALDRIKRLAPGAAVIIAGPPDMARVPEFAARQVRQSPTAGCRALSEEEQQAYPSLIAREDERLARWHPPLRLDDVRLVLNRLAVATGAYFWDWSAVMGGACGIHAWVHAKPQLALADRIHLTEEGYQRSAKALVADLLKGYAASTAAARPSR